MLLAIDTATRQISLALHDGKSLIAEQTWKSDNTHTIQLAPSVEMICHYADISMDDLTGLAVSIGPGSYTGLRIGVALAKGIASVRHLPLVGVTTLETIAAAQPYYQTGSALIAVVQAGRGRIIVESFKWRKGQWSSRSEPTIMDWQTLIASIDGVAYVTGEVNEAGFRAIENAQADDVPVELAPGANRLRRAGYIAELALEKLNAVDEPGVFAPELLVPLYLKSEFSEDSKKHRKKSSTPEKKEDKATGNRQKKT